VERCVPLLSWPSESSSYLSNATCILSSFVGSCKAFCKLPPFMDRVSYDVTSMRGAAKTYHGVLPPSAYLTIKAILGSGRTRAQTEESTENGLEVGRLCCSAAKGRLLSRLRPRETSSVPNCSWNLKQDRMEGKGSWTKLTQEAFRVMPWKNGLGSTTQFIIHPPEATLNDAFEWRLSSAAVSASGARSALIHLVPSLTK